MRTSQEIHQDIDRLSDERADLYKRLSAEYDAGVVADIHRLDAELDRLWDENPEDPDLLGLFEELPYMPAKVTIYRLPLVESFPEPDELEREIRITVLHELAHYFGIDEDRLDELGYS